MNNFHFALVAFGVLCTQPGFGQSEIADNLYRNRNYEAALPLYRRLSNRTRGDLSVDLLNRLAYCHLRLRNLSAADSLIAESLSKTHGAEAAEALIIQGELKLEQFLHEEAITSLTRAEELLEGAPANLLLARLHWLAGRVYANGLYNYPKARQHLALATQFLERSPDTYLQAMVDFEKAIIHNGESEKEQATLHILKSRKLLKGLQNTGSELAETENVWGAITMDIDCTALYHFRKAALISRSLPSSVQRFRTGKYICNQGVFHWIMRDFAKAKLEFWRALTDSRKSTTGTYTHSLACLDIGELYTEEGNFDSAAHYLSKSLAIRRSLFGDLHPEITYVLLHLSGLSLARKEPLEALENIERAIRSELKNGQGIRDYSPKGYYLTYLYVLSDRARAYRMLYDQNGKRGHLEAALESISVMDSLIQVFRRTYQWENSKINFSSNFRPSYELAVDCLHELFALTGDEHFADKAFALMDGIKFQALTERTRDAHLLASAEGIASSRAMAEGREEALRVKRKLDRSILSGSGDERFLDALEKQYLGALEAVYRASEQQRQVSSGNAAQPETERVDPVTFSQDQNCIILNLLQTPEALYRITIDQGRTSFEKHLLTPEALSRLDRFSAACTAPPDVRGLDGQAKAFQAESYAAYQILLGLDQSRLSAERLIVIPDNMKRLLPFDALTVLPDSARSFRDLSYLVRYLPVSYQFAWGIFTSRVQEEGTGIDSIGFFTSSAREYEAVKESTSSMAEHYDFALYGPSESSLQLFLQESSKYDIIHLGIHGKADSRDPLNNLILFPAGHDSVLYGYQIYKLALRARLVTLAACETALGAPVSGEGTYSIAHSFYYAGVPSLVTSLWKIEDWSSSRLTTEFYQRLVKGNDPVDESLRQTKLAFLETQDAVLSHPYYWSGMVAVGKHSPFSFSRGKMIWLYLLIGTFVLIAATLVLKIYRHNHISQNIS